MIYPDTFNNDRRFIFNNWSNADFTLNWAGQPNTVKAGESKEFPMSLAYHMTKHFVDQEMMNQGKESCIASDEERKPFELKTLAEINSDVDSPALADLKSKIEAEVVENQKNGKIKKPKAKSENKEVKKEFADIQ